MNPSARSPIPSPGRLGLLSERAGEYLETLGWVGDSSIPLRRALSRAPDPDLALAALVRLYESLAEESPDALSELDTAFREDPTLQARLLGLFGGSGALGDHLVAEPQRWSMLRGELPTRAELFASMLGAVEATPEETVGDEPVDDPALSPSVDLSTPGTYRAGTTGGEAVNALRNTYRDEVTRLAAHDLASLVDDEPHLGLEVVGLFLSDLADAALTAALAVAVATVFPDEKMPNRLAVIAMGKCGARELNYISDVDVIFVAEPSDPKAARVAGEMMRIGSMAFFEVDAALRPEGKAGELVRSLDSHIAYYDRWAKTWEFQALLKARPMTGHRQLAEAYINALSPKVWTASERDDFVQDVQAMRRRVEENVPDNLRDRELKLGRGGLRDVEFAVQLLQMVHGRTDEQLRTVSTLDSLRALRHGGYLAREDGANLEHAYGFIRLLEHRLQLQRYKRTHLLPEDSDTEGYRWLARASGITADRRRSASQNLHEELRRVRGRVRRLHEKLFYRPLLDSIAAYDADALALSPKALERQLAALGFTSPRTSLGHLRALATAGARRGRIHSLLLPTLLEWLASTPDPDAGLLAYRRISEEHHYLSWFLRVLRDDNVIAKRLMRVLGTSVFVADLLQNAPDVIKDLADGTDGPLLVRDDAGDIAKALTAAATRHRTAEGVVRAARSLRRIELARIGAADVLGLLPVQEVCERLTGVWTAVLDAALKAVIRDKTPRDGQAPARIAYIGMGRLGGRELSFGSDADVLIVCDPLGGANDEEALRWATSVAEQVSRLLNTPSSDPPLEIDTDLRPEGRRGPMVRTLASYRAYYSKWAEVWEWQALLRASFCAGDADLGLEFLHMIDVFRYPEGGVPEQTVREIRRIKARVDSERLPRGADPATHTKLGRGGLADVEWTAQLLTMQHASEVPGLHTTSTIEVLDAAADAELITDEERTDLVESWTLATHTRSALTLVRGKQTDQLPKSGSVLTGVAEICSGSSDGQEFLNHYLKVTRHGRKAVDRVFWGE